MKFINYAHRGASEYAPENTMLSFYTGVFMGANGIETDVQLTKDGVAVLFHDETVDRVTDGKGNLEDFTYQELLKLNVIKNGLKDKIVTLKDFLKAFYHQDLTFAIELKGKNTFKITADLLRKYNLEKKTVVTSFMYDELKNFKVYAPEFEAGYLVEEEITDELLNKMKSDGINEICPEAYVITPDLTKKWHELGFNVRAWGVYDENLMESCLNSKVDGMTVNFPDKLTKRLK